MAQATNAFLVDASIAEKWYLMGEDYVQLVLKSRGSQLYLQNEVSSKGFRKLEFHEQVSTLNQQISDLGCWKW